MDERDWTPLPTMPTRGRIAEEEETEPTASTRGQLQEVLAVVFEGRMVVFGVGLGYLGSYWAMKWHVEGN